MEILTSNVLLRMCLIAFGCIIFDVITGVVGALKNGEFKSQVMREGGFHKLMLLIVLLFGVFLDYAQNAIDIGVNIPAGNAICTYVIIMEICSVFENVKKAFPGILPKFITNAFDIAKREIEEK